jgi:HAD superfamily hydrolase (TIGR01509 family)
MKPEPAIKAIIFDCFGVIITDGLEAVLQDLDRSKPEAREFISVTIRKNNSGLMTPRESNQRIADYLGMTTAAWQQMVSVGEVRNAELLDWIVALRRHYYKTALLSNVGRGSMGRRFSEAELERLFDVVVISAEVGMLKPDPDIYRLTAERLGVTPAECLFIDDRESHVRGAGAAGMHGILYQSFQQVRTAVAGLLTAG